MAECYNIVCPYCVDYKCRRTCTCDMRLDGEYVKVVRCKDCKHLFSDSGYPLRTWRTHVETDYCSYGEPKEGNDGEVY